MTVSWMADVKSLAAPKVAAQGRELSLQAARPRQTLNRTLPQPFRCSVSPRSANMTSATPMLSLALSLTRWPRRHGQTHPSLHDTHRDVGTRKPAEIAGFKT